MTDEKARRFKLTLKRVKNYISLIFIFICFSAQGQTLSAVKSDSTTHEGLTILKIDSIKTNASLTLDSAVSKILSLKKSLHYRIDSLKATGKRTDKLQYKLDSLENLSSLGMKKFNNKLQPFKVDSVSDEWRVRLQHISKKPDSLKTKITKHKLALQQVIDRKTSFTDSLTLKANDPVSGKETNYNVDNVSLESSPNLSNANMPQVNSSLNKEVSEIESSTNGLNIPKVPIPKVPIPKVPIPKELQNIKEQTSKLEQLPETKLNELTPNAELGEIKGEMQKVTSVTGKVEAYNKDFKNIANGNAERAKALPKDIENAVTNQGQIRELNKEVKEAEVAKNVLKQYQEAASKMNEEGGKKALKDIASKQLPDYFSGQEKKLQAGVATLEKLKRRYGSIPDSRYLPKHAPSDMKGKSVIERIVPGINFQFFQISGLTVIDLSPFTMYRFTSRWRAGLGYTYRLHFNDKVQPVHIHDAFGYRIMTDYKVISGFHVHAEGEWMKMAPYDPTTNIVLSDSEKRQWIPGLYLGILKQYKAGPHINGNFQVMYNFIYHRNGLYPNRFNIRFGFEFPLKKKTR